AGTINRDSTKYRYTSWMAYITQAGVAIGLAQLAQRQFPEIGLYLATIVLAVIAINQVIGPVTFKVALGIVGEINKDD
ncbi:MAG: potassium transporter TrkA, partial [Deltaproteobacteria bacterium]|nr:potassium transporter TrkA [Deltaproteobacteria bacterium]